MKQTLIAAAIAIGAWAWVNPPTSQQGTESQGAAAVPTNRTTYQKLPSTVRIERTTDVSTLTTKDCTYQVTCKIVCDTMTFQTPACVVRHGERVTISDTRQMGYLVARIVTAEGTSSPIFRQISAGSEFGVTVLEVDEDRVLVDVSASLQSISPMQRDGNSDGQRVETLSGRFIQTVPLGESASASFGKNDPWSLEVSVQKG